MDHSKAIAIFEEIQGRPYDLSLNAGDSCNNCYFKGIELLKKLGELGELGYAVRGRGGETFWDEKIFGADITNLIPDDFLITHFFVEIFLNNEWRIIDPSYQPSLAQYGLTIGSWENGASCFPLTKIYSQEDFLAYQDEWYDKKYQNDFFERGRPAWEALNVWFEGK